MKRIFLLIVFVVLLFCDLLKAENNSNWGEWFKLGMENGKKFMKKFQPPNKKRDMEKWRKQKDKIISDYKFYLERDENPEDQNCEVCGDKDRRREILASYYYDKTDPEIDKVVDFFIFVIENEKVNGFKTNALNKLLRIALTGNEKAKNYIIRQKDNTSLPKYLLLRYKISYLIMKDDKATFDYLMNIIKKAQEVETTDIKYVSNDERIIAWFLMDNYFPLRYTYYKDYNYGLPLLRQLFCSRDKIVGDRSCATYYRLTNRKEMERIYKECWKKANDKTTPRKEYLDALYCLQSLYALQRWFDGLGDSKRNIGFKGIWSYFNNFAILEYKPEINKERCILVPCDNEKRVSDKEKVYFLERLDYQ